MTVLAAATAAMRTRFLQAWGRMLPQTTMRLQQPQIRPVVSLLPPLSSEGEEGGLWEDAGDAAVSAGIAA